MANLFAPDTSEDIPSDQQIHELLRDIERRRKTESKHIAQPRRVEATQSNALHIGDLAKPCVTTKHGVAHADTGRLLSVKDRKLSGKVRNVEDPIKIREEAVKEKKATAGSDWFHLPKTNLTSELKRDLQLLKMRNVLDPKRHYKKENGKAKAPEFSQVGTVIEGPTEYYSSRLPNRDRKRTFVEEVLAAEESTGRFKRKYNDIQALKTSGKKAYHKKLKEKRSKGVQKR